MTAPIVLSVKLVSKRLLYCLASVVGALLVVFSILIFMEKGFVLPVVLLFGSMGAFVSLQRRLKDLSEEDLQLFRESIPYTLLAPVAGGVMAGILYLLLIAGLLDGQLFPQFNVDTTAREGIGINKLFLIEAKDAADYAKLLFWSFVAGFSERFVTDIIGHFSNQAVRSPLDEGRADTGSVT